MWRLILLVGLIGALVSALGALFVGSNDTGVVPTGLGKQLLDRTGGSQPPADMEFRAEAPPFTMTLARPIFFKDRQYPSPISRPVDVQVVPRKVAASPPPRPAVRLPDRLRLLGVRLTGPSHSALIETPPGPPRWLESGAQVGEWLIARIGESHIELRHESRTEIIDLYPSRKKN